MSDSRFDLVAAPTSVFSLGLVVVSGVIHGLWIGQASNRPGLGLLLSGGIHLGLLLLIYRGFKSASPNPQIPIDRPPVSNSEARLAAVLDIADDAIITIDQQQRITLFNQGAERVFGYTAAETIGQPLDLLMPDRFQQVHRQHVQGFGTGTSRARRMGERQEIFGRRKDGTEFPAEASISRVQLGDERIYTVILRDVTQRKQIDRMKDEFISVVSHELRTPLTSIHGSLRMLESGLLKLDSSQGQRLLKIASESTDRLVRLINDILDIERMESGKVQMERMPCEVSEILQATLDLVQPLADKAGIRLESTDLSTQILADRDRIIQTLTNLLSNAIKFSPSGSPVWLQSEVIPGFVQFSVRDQGRGIPVDKLDSVFERFQQVDSSDARHHDGTGLGLAICRSIVQQHQGEIWVDSTLGEGSTFYFTIPIVPPAEAPVPSPPADLEPASSPPAPVILICDDDSASCNLLETLLRHYGYEVMTASSQQELLDKAIAHQPATILLDPLMAEMNGWEIMARLKQQPQTQAIPIVICSLSESDDRSLEGSQAFGFSGNREAVRFFEQLQAAIGHTTQQMSILIVEDDPHLAQVLMALFGHYPNLRTYHAQSGSDAIRLSQEILPDLLVLDLIVPEVDGFAVVEWLKRHRLLRNTPLVVYSARDLNASERHRLQLGPTEFLTKGRVTPQEFEQRVMALLARITQHFQEDR